MAEFLDASLCSELREKINETNIFVNDAEYNKHYYLICVVMDRLDTCVDYLNKNSVHPRTEEDFMVFMMYASMVVDAIKLILKDIDKEYKYIDTNAKDEYHYFKKVCMEEPMSLKEESVPTDDKFFEYLRALIFAHPFGTNHPKFLKKGETQYAPWVFARNDGYCFKGIDAVGVRVFSSMDDDIKDIGFSFQNLKDFIQSRYNRLEIVIDWVQKVIDDKHADWSKRKVNRNLEPANILSDIADILKERYENDFYVNDAISYLTCNITNKENMTNVNLFRDEIVKKIPLLCNAIDRMDYEELDELLASIFSVRPSKMHKMANYQLEKIFDYCNDRVETENVDWGRKQADIFYKEFAFKWVKINAMTMDFDEIKLLVTVACYLEHQEQVDVK